MLIRSLAKSTVLTAARRLGVNSLCRHARRNKLLILCYHGVVSDDNHLDAHRHRVAVTVREFRRQLEIVARLFNPVSAQDLLDWVEGRATLPSRPALITFDDGFRNNLTLAAGELESRGVPALFFVTTGYVGTDRILWPHEVDEHVLHWKQRTFPSPKGGPDIRLPSVQAGRADVAERVRTVCKRLPDAQRRSYLERLRNGPSPCGQEVYQQLYKFLTWDDVRDLHGRGFAIGSHTVEHPILARLSPQELDRELRQSKAAVQRQLDAECPWIAYPNGEADDVTEQVIQSAKQAGYKTGFMLTGRRNSRSTDPLRLDRVSVSARAPTRVFHASISGTLGLAQSLSSARR